MGLGGERFLFGHCQGKGKRKTCTSSNPTSSKRGCLHTLPDTFPELGSRAPRQDQSLRSRAATQGFGSEFPNASNPHWVFQDSSRY